jgi:predicted RNase H-like HicB family nuclease
MNQSLERQATKLAQQPYHIIVSRGELDDGQTVIFLTNLELLGCSAQGNTLQEALQELAEVTEEYILGLLEDGIPVPSPYSTSSTLGAQVVELRLRLGGKHDEKSITQSTKTPVEIESSEQNPASTEVPMALKVS